jgi:hypothetical protein
MPFQKGRDKTGGRHAASVTMPRLLKAMRAVFGQDESKDQGEEQKNARRMLTADPKGFLGHMAGLEKQFASLKVSANGKAAAPATSPDEEPEHDEGLENARAVLERVLRELSEEARRE